MAVILKSCKFFSSGNCSLGYHNGKPHAGNCRACIAAGENNRDHAERMLDFSDQVKSAAIALSRFTRSGFTLADSETLAKRQETCRSCDFWDRSALNGTGRCQKCGCSTWAKIRMASEKCPVGKW